MNRDQLFLKIKAKIPEATEPEINASILNAMDKINENGLEQVVSISVKAGTSPVLVERTSDMGFNYYLAEKALVLPDTLVEVQEVTKNGKEVYEGYIEDYMNDLMRANTYVLTSDNIMYLADTLADSTIISIKGRFGITNDEIMNAKYQRWLTAFILMDLTQTGRHKNPDLFSVQAVLEMKAFENIDSRSISNGSTRRIMYL